MSTLTKGQVVELLTESGFRFTPGGATVNVGLVKGSLAVVAGPYGTLMTKVIQSPENGEILVETGLLRPINQYAMPTDGFTAVVDMPTEDSETKGDTATVVKWVRDEAELIRLGQAHYVRAAFVGRPTMVRGWPESELVAQKDKLAEAKRTGLSLR